MGICDSSISDTNKKVSSDQEQKLNIVTKNKKTEEENSNNIETHPSSNSQIDNKSSPSQEIQNRCPQLAKYERSNYNSGKRSELSNTHNHTSYFSSALTEEELIIRGEINPKCKNKEEDFDNNSFKKLVKNNGGIFLKNTDQYSNISSSQGINSIFDFGKETISEIRSKHSFSFKQYNGNKINNSLKGSGVNQNLRKSNASESNKNLINRMKKNNCNFKNFKINEDKLSYLNVPKTDEPLPDIDELSAQSPINLGRNSLISQ